MLNPIKAFAGLIVAFFGGLLGYAWQLTPQDDVVRMVALVFTIGICCLAVWIASLYSENPTGLTLPENDVVWSALVFLAAFLAVYISSVGCNGWNFGCNLGGVSLSMSSFLLIVLYSRKPK